MSDERSCRDRATRALAQSEFRVPLVVEAGAGTGKTALLVARVAAWCLGDGWEPKGDESREQTARRVIEGVVAITFTEAAAAEMATRIGEALAGIAASEPPVGWIPGETVVGLESQEITARAEALSDEMHRLRVTTIHAFCQRVLTAHPFEAGLHPRFEIDADGDRLEALVDEVALEALRSLEDSPAKEAWEALAARGTGPVEVAAALQLLVTAGARPSDLEHDPFDDDAALRCAGGVLDSLRTFLDADDGRLAGVKGAPAAMRTVGVLSEIADRLGEAGAEVTFVDLAAALELVDKKTRDRLRNWSKLKLGKAEARCLDDDIEFIAELAGDALARFDGLRGLDPEAFGAARTVLLSLLREVETKRAERGIATFTDLLVKTALLLEEHEGICRTERQGMDQLLVDEFQDTDDVQCRIVRRLGLEGPDDERPGLFVVGDPKQSIYAWRSADLKAYDEFVEEVLDCGGAKHPLTSNFRSVTPILDEVERLVEPVMHEKHGFQPAFEGLDATEERARSPGFRTERWSAVEYWNCRSPEELRNPEGEKLKTDEINAVEARAIAADIRALHDEAGVPFGDVAVLLRATTKQHFLLDAFRELDVPFEVSREREYYRKREIIEAAGLVRAILEPADALALLTVVRSDAVGVPDAALAPLWDAGLAAAAAGLNGSDGPAIERVRRVVADAAARVGDVPGADQVPRWPDVLTAALERLAELRRSLTEDPPDVFVERLRTLWLAEVSAAARYLGRFRQARLDCFFAELERTLGSGRGGAAEVARFLRRAVEESREAPSEPEPDLESDAVHVMTIYGAKGLDFGHVYLAQIHRGTGSFRSEPAVLRRTGDAAELQLFGWPTPGFGAAEHRRELQARAERVRLLYVATTRAKQRFVVSGGWFEPGIEVPPLEAKSFSDLVARRDRAGVFERLAGEGIERELEPETGVSWVLPGARSDDSDDLVARSSESSDLAPPETVAADAAAIAAARRRAAERMSARWSVPASDAAHRNEGRRAADLGGDEAPSGTPRRRSAAAAVGTEIHRVLEILDLGRSLSEQLGEQRREAVERATAGLNRAEAEEAAALAGALLDRLAGSRCLAQLTELTPRIVARELDVFMEPASDDGTSVISGAVDLLYTDPDDGRLVVADYKTDAVETDDEVNERTERYRPQLAVYAEALQKALKLDEPPHTELWFLGVDRIVRTC